MRRNNEFRIWRPSTTPCIVAGAKTLNISCQLSLVCDAGSLSVLRGVYTTEQKWHGSDKNWNGSKSFCKETVKFYPFRNWSIGACGPDTERIKLHCFFAKTIGTVPIFVGSVPFLLCRVNAFLRTNSPVRESFELKKSQFLTLNFGYPKSFGEYILI